MNDNEASEYGVLVAGGGDDPVSDALDDAHRMLGHNRHPDGSAHQPMDEVVWEERYRAAGALWSGKPNPQLVSEVSDLPPRVALDAGCGEGADAIWLAERGWMVTAVDFSTVALERGAARAREVGAKIADRITWIHANLMDWIPATQSFDLVSIHFMHFPKDQRELLYGRLAESVAPGGTLLVVAHHPSDLQTSVRRPHTSDMFFTGDELATQFDPAGWDIITNAAPARSTPGHDGYPVTIHDTVFRALRRSREF